MIEVTFDCYIWNAEKTKILHHFTKKISEGDLKELIENLWDDDQLPCPINLNKEEVIFETEIDSIKS